MRDVQWRASLARKMNLIAVVSMCNMLLGSIYFLIFDQIMLFWVCFGALLILPLVFLINYFKKSIQAVYWYYCISFVCFMFLNLLWGVESFIFLWYFPLIFSMVQLLSKPETIKHLMILCGITLLFVAALIVLFWGEILSFQFGAEKKQYLFAFNVLGSFITTIVIIAIISIENNRQEKQIKKMLAEKEVLLAEVFHRVKNNLNIVTSLLSLKKNTSDSEEVREALEACKNRIYSMALVHNNLIHSDASIALNFKEYIKALVSEIALSLGVEQQVKLVLLAEEIEVDMSHSIPCGLILNELITNSYKYAQREGTQLQIAIRLKKEKDRVELLVSDNGPGVPEAQLLSTEFENTLGVELIKALSEQINGDYRFYNKDGFCFSLSFSLV